VALLILGTTHNLCTIYGTDAVKNAHILWWRFWWYWFPGKTRLQNEILYVRWETGALLNHFWE